MQNKELLHFPDPVCQRLRESDIKITVTGASGWLGSVALEMLDQCLGDEIGKRVFAYGLGTRDLKLRSGRRLPCFELATLAEQNPEPSLLMHFAFLTRDRVAGMPLKEFIEKNESISAFVGEQAKRLRLEGVFVPSSGAVYRPDRTLDYDLEKNPYGVLKARDELRFSALAEKGKTKVAQCRVFNMAGPFINKLRNYALSSVLLDIANGGPIEFKAAKRVERSYFHVGNLIGLAFSLVLLGEPPFEPFDTAGERIVELDDLAHAASAALGKTGIEIRRPLLSAETPDRYVGDGKTLGKLLSLHGIAPLPLETQIRDTARFLGIQT
jgi:nucleoside-diphosphate-sugar epimerase